MASKSAAGKMRDEKCQNQHDRDDPERDYPTRCGRRRIVAVRRAQVIGRTGGIVGVRISHALVWSAGPTQHCLHLIDLSLLTGDDSLAEASNVRVSNGRLLTHQNHARMVRNHGSQELPIRNRGRSPDEQKEPNHPGDTGNTYSDVWVTAWRAEVAVH